MAMAQPFSIIKNYYLNCNDHYENGVQHELK